MKNIDNLYAGIGRKIKAIAKGTFIVEAFAAVFFGIIVVIVDIVEGFDGWIALGLLLIIVGPFVAWLSTLLIYGFGELIDKSTEIARNTQNEKSKATEETTDDANAEQKRLANAEQKRLANAEQKRLAKLEKLRKQGLITEEEYSNAILKK